jgi:hypothetical protein
MIDLKQYEVWFVTGSQHLYGPETLEKVAEHSREIAAALGNSNHIPVQVIFKPVHPPALPGGEFGQGLYRVDHLDAHFFPGQDVDRGVKPA